MFFTTHGLEIKKTLTHHNTGIVAGVRKQNIRDFLKINLLSFGILNLHCQ